MLPPKKSNKKPNPRSKYKKPASGDSLAEDIFEIVDPTGISSYDDVYRSYKDNGLFSWQTGLEVLGALPIIGKAGKGIKAARTANKYIKALTKVNKTVAKAEKVIPTVLKQGASFGKAAQKVSKGGKANPIAAAAIVTGKGAEGLQKVTKAVEKVTTKGIYKLVAKAPAKKEIIETAAQTINTINTLSDTAGAVQGQVSKPKEKNLKPKVVYYNTNSKHGKVETPGNEEGVQYVPVSNSAQLQKWKDQKLAFGTNSQGIMKRKMNPVKKYANGTNSNGVGPNNYIQTPAEALNDYNIMLAKAEAESLQDPLLPIVAIGSQILQTGIGMAGSMGGAAKPTNNAVNPAINTEAVNSFDFTKGNQGAILGTGATAAMGMNDVQEDVEVEGGEMYETPQGEVGEFEGPSHEQGGIPLEVGQDVEEGTKVYSDRLKVGGKTLAERKEARERKIANLEKAASDKLVDVATKNALKRRMEAVQKEEASDLQFQEQVNNMQAMADTMVKAFGTGMKGIQKYAMGTSADGIYFNGTNSEGITDPRYGEFSGIQYSKGFKLEQFKPFLQNYVDESNTPKLTNLNWGDVENRKAFQKKIGTKEDGIFGPDTMKKAQEYFALQPEVKGVSLPNPIEVPSIGNLPLNERVESPVTEAPGLDSEEMTARQFGAFKGETPEHFTGEMDTSKKEPSKVMEALAKMELPAVGDMAKLMGNYLGMTAGMKNAAESRSTDVTHTNVYKNAGKESQKLLDNAKASIEGQKAQAIIKASTTSRGGKKGARGSARGVNQMRAMDWLYDTALNQQIAEISANAAGQLSQIDVQKSGVAMNADQLKGQGEYQANMANEAAKDAYYTALGLGKKDFATGLQQTGADLNDMRQNKILEKLLTQDGNHVGMTRKGDMYGKPVEVSKTKKEADSKEELKLEVDAAGNKFIMISGKKMIIKD